MISSVSREARRSPSAHGIAVSFGVAITLEALEHIEGRRVAGLFREHCRFVRAPPAAAQEHGERIFRNACLQFLQETLVRPHPRIRFPFDFDRTRHAADEVPFRARSHVDQHGFGVILQQLVCFGGA